MCMAAGSAHNFRARERAPPFEFGACLRVGVWVDSELRASINHHRDLIVKMEWSGGVEKREMSGLERCSSAVEAAA